MGGACTQHHEPHVCLQSILQLITDNDTNFTRADLSGRRLGIKGANEVSEALRSNTTLTTLFLSWNCLEDEGLGTICGSLQDNNTLTTLILAGNKITDKGSQHIVTFLNNNNSLTHLSLSENHLALEGAKSIISTLEHNTSLTALSLGGNQIASSSANELVEFLKNNSTLCVLELGDNPIPPEVQDELQTWSHGRMKLMRQYNRNFSYSHRRYSNPHLISTTPSKIMNSMVSRMASSLPSLPDALDYSGIQSQFGESQVGHVASSYGADNETQGMGTVIDGMEGDGDDGVNKSLRGSSCCLSPVGFPLSQTDSLILRDESQTKITINNNNSNNIVVVNKEASNTVDTISQDLFNSSSRLIE